MPTVRCPNCSAKLDAPAEYNGRSVKCKHCGQSFVLRLIGRSRTAVAGKAADRSPPQADSTVSFHLAKRADPALGASKVRARNANEDQTDRPRSEKLEEPISVAAESWRAALYQRVTAERFDGDFSAFAQAALDALAEKLGYPVKPPQ
jgi:DNA-directed RNA polymerase subunit RPC12/RpoP